MMKRILSYIKKLFINLYKAIERFPVTIGFTTATTIVLISISNNQSIFGLDTNQMSRIAMILALGAPISLCINLIFEKIQTKRLIRISAYILEGVFLLIYYYFLLDDFNMVQITRYTAISMFFYLAFLFIPYIYKRQDFELYVIKVLTSFFVSVIYSIVLFAGLSAIFFALDTLLSVPVPYKTYYHIWLITAGVFAPSLFFAGIPIKNHKLNIREYPKLFKTLLQYIVMPLISVYTAILYIYFIKIIITQQWPVGLVSHLVLWYSVISAGVIFFISPVEAENKWSKGFVFWLPKLILPILLMMFVSIGIRIKAYGVTENRYYVIALGLWSLGIMIYYSLRKKKTNIVLPISLCVIIILSMFGPLSSFAISKRSQNNRFENILVKNDMVKENKIKKSTETISTEDKVEISQIIDYFKYSHELKDMKFIPDDFEVDDMEDIFGFAYEPRRIYPRLYLSYGVDCYNRQIDIKGYDYMYAFRYHHPKTVEENDVNLEINFDKKNTKLHIFLNGNETYSKDFYEFARELDDRYGERGKYTVDFKDVIFEDENNNLKLKIIFENIYGDKDEDGGLRDITMDFYLFVKLK